MDFAELTRLTELFEKSRLRELTLRQGDSRLTLRKATEQSTALVAVQDHAWEEAEISEEAVLLEVSFAGVEAPENPRVTAPSVGIFHHVKPVVGLGARVIAGQVMGAIESMKLMQEVSADVEGVVTDVLVEDGMPVEYGQPLFLLARTPSAER